MTTTTSPAGARTNTPAPRPTGRLQRLAAPLAPYATAVRVAGGVLTISTSSRREKSTAGRTMIS